VDILETPAPDAPPQAPVNDGAFSVHLDNFDGPFDLLLQLISKHKLDITEVSLSLVTDEFISFIRALEASGEGWRLDQATEFLVIAATLLDLKAARLLPSGEIEDEEDLALLEARDILFARLLQYRAFKEIAANFQEAIAAIADRVLTPKVAPVVAVEHLHSALVSVAEESRLVVEALRKGRTVSFRSLIHEADSTLVVVARFLALLDLYRQGALRFEQVVALGELQISWVGSDEGEILVTNEFDIPVGEQYPEEEVEGTEPENPQVEVETTEESEDDE
jgi:segregation and condensation protein A